MKRTFGLIVILFSSTILLGQAKPKTAAIVIQGQITDCPEKYLLISFLDKNGELLIDTLKLDESGKFYLKTYKLIEPQRTSIQQNNIQINNIFVAPGYQLTITGNGKDLFSLIKTKKISGIGSESNHYRFLLDSILFARMDVTQWVQLNENDLLSYISNDQKLKDSIANIVFNKKAIQDKYLKYFGKLVQLDNKFTKLSMLLAYINFKNYNYENSIAFIREHFDNQILDNLYKDEYLISSDYRNSVVGGEYLDYILNLDYQKDSTLQDQKDYKLKKVNTTYQGKAKELALYKQMRSAIAQGNSFEEINDYKKRFHPYISNFKNEFYKKSIENRFEEKEAELVRTQVGKPAPKFILQSNAGDTYSLEDFKNKVVYLDLWASWCGPCRAETPSFKKLYSKYKNDNRIVFVSIAVIDGRNEWEKALEEDKPDWLQLLDKEGVVWKSYVANTIPKFIIIDKQGNILNFNAPRPSSGEEIEKLLNQEISK